MSVLWKVKIHKLVLAEDFKSIDYAAQKIILKDIAKKLTVEPLNYGERLRGEFKGYWKLRVKDYRVVYRVKQDAVEVLVIKVGIRRDEKVYRELFHRIKKL
jgi:mRNA interferase RelE/StbE